MRRLLSLLLFAAGAATSARAAAPLTTTRFGGVPYVGMIQVCGRLGLRFVVSGDGRSMTIANWAHHGVLLPPNRVNAREIALDGVRVFLGDPVFELGGRFFVSLTDYEKRLLPLFRPDLLSPRLRAPRLIVLDPGHGGVDPGAQNPRFGLKEKALTLDVAFRLKRLLEAQGWAVLLTRDRDTQLSTNKYVDLPLRSDVANRSGADLFLSIHFDADANPRVQGSEILTFAPEGQRSTDGWGRGVDDRLSTAAPGDREVVWSTVLAHALFRELVARLHTADLGERLRHVAVLRFAGCPGALVEPVFISNALEASRAAQPEFRQEVAEALAAGLRDYALELDALNPGAAHPVPTSPGR